MPVIDHTVSAMTKRTDDQPYGCANQPRKDRYYGTQRVYHADGTYHLEMAPIIDRLSNECRYDHSLADPRCATCGKRGSGERYSEMIRREGR
jgi:hypothetical protein